MGAKHKQSEMFNIFGDIPPSEIVVATANHIISNNLQDGDKRRYMHKVWCNSGCGFKYYFNNKPHNFDALVRVEISMITRPEWWLSIGYKYVNGKLQPSCYWWMEHYKRFNITLSNNSKFRLEFDNNFIGFYEQDELFGILVKLLKLKATRSTKQNLGVKINCICKKITA